MWPNNTVLANCTSRCIGERRLVAVISEGGAKCHIVEAWSDDCDDLSRAVWRLRQLGSHDSAQQPESSPPSTLLSVCPSHIEHLICC